MFDPQAFKQHFPLFLQNENRGFIYLDNAATTQRPQVLLDATRDFYLHANANAHRGSHRLARDATDVLERCRQQVAAFINAEPNACVFTTGATMAMNTVANAVCERLQEGDEIVLSLLEHHANIVPWMMQAEQKGLVIRFLPLRDGALDLDALPGLLNERTKVVSLSAASNVLGGVTDVAAVKRLLAGGPWVWGYDCAQYAAHARLDVAALGCDFVVFSAHKLYGPTGVGVLWTKPALLNQWSPLLGGGEMISEVTVDGVRFREAPGRFEAGTDNLAGIAGFAAVLQFLSQCDLSAMHVYEAELAQYAIAQLARLPQITLVGSRDNNIGVLAYVLSPDSGFGVSDVVNWLDESDIAVRAGQMCAQPLADALGHPAMIRLSLAAYNTREDIDRTVAVLQQLFEGTSRQASQDNDALLASLLAEQQWQSRYRLIMALGDRVTANPALRHVDFIVPGCEAKVWLRHRVEDGRCYFEGDSEARLMRGLMVILFSLVDGKSRA
ncbi:MAG TPA: aminotransferase class V-fold PLP-dependent enzyme, partial [Pseudomonadales bacterium]|nr:aminotransferase class V-fold PLP-dependent enzyme [Pseudomonadales bacterium]